MTVDTPKLDSSSAAPTDANREAPAAQPISQTVSASMASASEPRTSSNVPHPLSMQAHPTVWTVALAVVFAVVLSLLPLPEFLRPLPFREKGVKATLTASLMPQRNHKSLDQIRKEVPLTPKTAAQDELQGLLAASFAHDPTDERGDSGENDDASEDIPSGGVESDPEAMADGTSASDGIGDAQLNAASDANVSREKSTKRLRNDPGFWLKTNSAPPLNWLVAGAKKSKDFLRIETFAAGLGTVDQAIIDPCIEPKDSADEACSKRALDGFLSALDEVVDGTRSAPIRIAHFGNSLIASDFVAATIRRELSDRYGSGGTGFLLVDRPTRIAGNFDRVGRASEGWQAALLTDKGERLDFGLTGARFVGGMDEAQPNPTVAFDIKDAITAEIFWLSRPDGGDVSVIVDGTLKTTISTKQDGRISNITKVALRPGSKELSLKVSGGPVELYGVSLENGRSGIVHDTYGLAGGTADVFLQANAKIFEDQLKARNPNLVIIMLGGNETYEMSRGWMSLNKAKATVDGFIERIQSDVPEASCLVTSQLDAGIRNASSEITPRPFADEVRSLLRESAISHGCAFWDMYEFMGGKGSVERWFNASAMNEDLIHPRQKGAEVLGHALVSALERTRLKRPTVADDLRRDPPGIGRPERLENFFDKLSSLERKEGSNTVNVVQIGASHTAAHFFTDQARRRFSERFGEAGYGFIAAGRASKRLLDSGVERELKGSWKVEDARDHGGEGLWGLTGIRAVGNPGAKQTWRFGIGAKGNDSRTGKLTLHWLDSPKFHGEMSLTLDGKSAGKIQMGTAKKQQLNLHTIDVIGPTHTLEVKNESQGKIALFGASLDLDGPGIHWDALGLPGATAMLADKFDKTVFSKALADRKADLLVVFYGTNEAAIDGLTAEAVKSHYGALIGSFKAASPDADCLLIGPTDRLSPTHGPNAIAKSIDIAIAAIRDVAMAEGCAFWSSRRAMGGTRSMKRWQEAGLGHRDGVHLTHKGYNVLADALVDALFQELDVHNRSEAEGPGAK